jgi:hypothetical protein
MIPLFDKYSVLVVGEKHRQWHKIIVFLFLFFGLFCSCDRAVNTFTIKVQNKLPSAIEVYYGNYPFNNGVYKKTILAGEIYQLANEKNINFFNVVDCRYALTSSVVDSLAVKYNGLVSKNLMYDHEYLFECIPAKTNSKGTQVWILQADSLVFQ